MVRDARVVQVLIGLLLISSLSPFIPATLEDTKSNETVSRSTTTWTGTRVLTSHYTVAAGDTLVIDAGSTVFMNDDLRIFVEGELDITGTASNPVVFASSSTGIAHEGIQFNATSRNRGSSIQHLIMEDAEFGFTIYDSNPSLNDVYLDNPDYVGIDMYDNAEPVIQRLTVQDGGQDVAGLASNARSGIAISAGVSSRPIILGATIDGLTTRGINLWGDSDGYFRDVAISNITHIGNQGWQTAGVWVEDSLGLFDNVTIDRTDNGIWVEHYSTGATTRPTFREVTVSNSMYRGVNVEQDNRSNFNSPLNAIFENLTVTGTGGPNAKTSGICNYAIGLNTTGVDMTDVLVKNNQCNGFKAYMIDSATIVRNLTVENSGDSNAVSSNDKSGVFIRSSSWASNFHGLDVSGSPGHGIYLSKASLIGDNWSAENNSGVGLYAHEAHPRLHDVKVANNGLNGLRIYDSSNVEIFDLESTNNGNSALITDLGFGLYFEKSNDLMSGSKNVSCTRCSSTQDASGGVRVIDSIDLQFHNLVVTDPGNNGYAVDIDNTGMNFNGWVDIHGLHASGNRSGPLVQLIETEAHISNLTIIGSNNGIAWDGSGVSLTSSLDYTILTGNNCIEFTDLHHIEIDTLDLSGCSGQINLRDSSINMSNSILGTSTIFDLTGLPSTLRWIDSGALDSLAQNIGVGSQIDKMWTLDLWALNQNSHGLPYAVVNLSFTELNAAQTHTLPYSGNAVLGPFLYQRTDSNGLGNWVNHSIGCEYDGQRTDFTSTVTEDGTLGSKTTFCVITLTNQAPLIVWSTPSDNDVFSSGGEVTFNATETWDLDNDPITWTWTSNIDGQFSTTDMFTVNSLGGSTYSLSDGEHVITLQVCDNQGNCANETRDIVLRNLPPVVTIVTDPSVDFDGTLRLYRTAALNINMSGTFDPEGDTILCTIDVSYRSGDTGPPIPCSPEWNETFSDAASNVIQFDYTITITDDVNTPIEIIYAIELVNELPHPIFTISRDGNTSGHVVTLDGTASYDPEGNPMIMKWESDLTGELPYDNDGNDFIWTGRLPNGLHELTLSLSDDQASHIGVWSVMSISLNVENSAPIANISSHSNFTTDSSVLHIFEAFGSGDWDLKCTDFPSNISSNYICKEDIAVNSDNIAVRWDSSLIEGALGTDWTLTKRLPTGLQTLNFTVDDNVNLPSVYSIEINVIPSAPVLIISSPVPEVEVYSDAPVLFDFRQSFDAEGDDFWVNISSNLANELIVENGTTGYWYNNDVHLVAGEHTLTFTATDSTGLTRIVNQTLIVLPTGPHAAISGMQDGDTLPAGEEIHFNGTSSYDADGDIIQWVWHQIENGQAIEIANDDDFTMWFRSRTQAYTFTLTVRDSRGISDTAWVNVTLNPTDPVLSNLNLDVDKLVADSSNTFTVSVQLSDEDGTTQLDGSVNGVLKVAGESFSFTLLDGDEPNCEECKGDNVYTAEVTADIGSSDAAKLEVWAADGEYSSEIISLTIQVEKSGDETGIAAILSSPGVISIAGIMLILAIIGGLMTLRSKKQLAADLEMIESWGTSLSGNETNFDSIADEGSPEEPNMDAELPPALSDFGDVE
ncbi:MAG: hypothetical protein QF440_00495 [Candidatus Thalassarchaeaceae archaeon]|nr:hypothetical protein [Candidatus Thalassarchaeaceae archaeon]